MDGVLVIDKPPGPTSHDVVAVVRRALRVERAGHTGTLDPLATGVLAIVIGRATRLASFLSGADKEYVARIRFGASTATYDAEPAAGAGSPLPGEIAGLAPAPAESALAAALPGFVGTYPQQPPPFSAKKIEGTPAYKLARKGKPVDIKPSIVTVHELELRSYAEGLAELRLVCSSGFYVRSLAHDLGQRLGSGAFLEGLTRTRAGDFTLDDAVTLDALAGGDGPAAAGDRLISMERLLPHLPSVRLTAEGARRASHGNTLSGRDFMESLEASRAGNDAEVRLLDADGRLLGIAKPGAGGLLHPAIVLV